MPEAVGLTYSEKLASINVQAIKLQSMVSVYHVGYLVEVVNLTHRINVHLARIKQSSICLDINAWQTVQMEPIKINRHLNVKGARLVVKFVIK